ncbi:class I SAM-dependent methyltransferase [Nocardioidaceae bacterium]|nr:class I SAM-dependent methyltransferase [Nocardioidaceae bacterium]
MTPLDPTTTGSATMAGSSTDVDLQERIDAYWDDRAASYDAYQQRPERFAADCGAWARVWASALPAAPARVLDVGCGSGHVALLLADLGHDVLGLDRSHEMLAIARAHAAARGSSATFRHGDAHDPDLEPGSFDAVVGRYVMWTLRDPVVAVERWTRLLRPGGVVAVVDARWSREGLGGMYGVRPRTALPLADATSIDDTAEAVRAGGLVDVTVTPLTEIRELDEAYGVAPGHDLVQQYLVSGRTAQASST